MNLKSFPKTQQKKKFGKYKTYYHMRLGIKSNSLQGQGRCNYVNIKQRSIYGWLCLSEKKTNFMPCDELRLFDRFLHIIYEP